MTRKIWALGFLALFSANLVAADNPANPKEKAGYALLDTFITGFAEMAAQGAKGAMEPALVRMAQGLKKAREAGEIDAVLHGRFARLLAITKLVIAPDPEGIIGPVVDRELSFFVQDMIGEEFKRRGPEAINQVANAIAEEILNLQIYLDTKDKREEMRKKLDAKLSGKES